MVRPARLLLAFASVAALAAPAVAQTVATGAGRGDEVSEAARIDAYLADASSVTPADRSRVTASEARASASALPPMDADSPWSRGLVGPTTGPLTLAGVNDQPVPCDHRVHGEVGAEIGTSGERGGYGVATLPVDKDCRTQVTVGVGTQRGPRFRGRAGEVTSGSIRVDSPGFSLGLSGASSRGPGYGYGYPYGYGGPY